MTISRRNFISGSAIAAVGAVASAALVGCATDNAQSAAAASSSAAAASSSAAAASESAAAEQTAAAIEFLGRPLITTAEDAADKAAIYELLSFERFARDNALWDAMKECYAKDSVVTISWYKGDGAGFVDASAAQDSYAPHKIYNYITWLNADKAVTFMMARCEMRAPIEGVMCEVGFDTSLVFRTSKIDGQWYISYFDSIYNKDSLYTVLPSNKLDADASKVADKRPSYSALAYYLGELGGKVDQELLGRDRPEQVQEFYAELKSWLNS